MLCYWIVRRPDKSAAGLVRVENDRVTLKLSGPVAGTFMLFSKTDAVPIAPDSETHLCGAEAVLGTEDGRVTCFAAAVHAAPLARYRERLSRKCTKEESRSPRRQADPAQPEPEPAIPKEQSQIYTIEAEQTEETGENIGEISQINTMNTKSEPGNVSDTARETEAFSELLRRADAFYEAYEGIEPTEQEDNMVQKEDISAIDLFPDLFPGARWRYTDGRDVLPHYEGVWTQPDGTAIRILAVRGRAAPRPPRQLAGFARYLRDRDGLGYWVKTAVLRQ